MGKIKDKQERVGGQRERKIERENEMNGEQGGDASGQFDELHGRGQLLRDRMTQLADECDSSSCGHETKTSQQRGVCRGLG